MIIELRVVAYQMPPQFYWRSMMSVYSFLHDECGVCHRCISFMIFDNLNNDEITSSESLATNNTIVMDIHVQSVLVYRSHHIILRAYYQLLKSLSVHIVNR